ncbi:hypothetical protein Glove_194g218 [Diversispora epigaea]|uniref:Uncharacterized protein n=1 Tax=Diversispora epigaea TaxID=1348612 RepID=A0A397IVI7_9GLOM|nr:hypothetical protein Glove_194g218 [Diversispora epigaea]
MAFKFYYLAAANEIETSSFNFSPSPLRKLYNNNKEIGAISLAHTYLYGLGVEKDTKKAFWIFYKLDLLQHKQMFACYERGEGITKDEIKGFQWIIKSALAGNVDAMSNVGCYYCDGIGIDKDEKEAFKWFLKSAEKGF